MSTTRYRIINCDTINVRKTPSINASIICTLNGGDTVQVVDGWSKTTTETKKGSNTKTTVTWYKIKSNDKEYYISSKYLRKVVNYLSLVAKYADTVYKKIIEIKCKHKYSSDATTYAGMVAKKMTTCDISVSCVLQMAGMLPEGKLIGHTEKVGSESDVVARKNSISKAIMGVDNLKKGTYKIHKIGKTYVNMESKYKKKGIVYVQNSNICINAGDGYIYSTNNASSQLSGGRYVKDKLNGKNDYVFTHKILYAIVPVTEY